MIWSQVEKAFYQSLVRSFSKKKMGLVFPILVCCGLFFVFCRAVAFEASDWIAMSLTFLPILLSSGILLALGVILARIHYHETKQLSLDLKRLISGSVDLIIGTSYLSVPPVLAYLLLWVLLGIFYLLKEIPYIGDFFSVVFSFAPFLLIFTSLLLCLTAFALLFFVAPAAALQPLKRVSLKRVFETLQKKPLSCSLLFLIALIPISLLTLLLITAAFLTNMTFLTAEHSLSVGLEWFFIMLPFCAILTPSIVFFFNFATESYQLLQPASSPYSASSEKASV